jgi:hypothetical protein
MKRSKMSSFFSKGNCVPQLHIQSKWINLKRTWNLMTMKIT